MFLCRICDINIAVEIIHPDISLLFSDYMIDNTEAPCITLAVTAAELDAESKKYPMYSAKYNEFVLLFKKLILLLLEYDIFFFHSAVTEYNGEGYVFTGKSGAGKSTHAMLWQKYMGAEIINCDKPLFKLIDGEFYAYGNPWAGKEGLHKNARVKVKAVTFIEQSTENSISRISSAEVLSSLFNQTVYLAEPHQNSILLGLLDKFLTKIPFYRLKCNISEGAVTMAYNAMKEEL